jgi:hypothetical protein
MRRASVEAAEAAAAIVGAEIEQMLQPYSARLLAALTSETSPNNYPRLPIHEDQAVIAIVLGFPRRIDLRDRRGSLQSLGFDLARTTSSELLQVLCLNPTRTSVLDGDSPSCCAARVSEYGA